MTRRWIAVFGLAALAIQGCTYDPYRPPPLAASGDAANLKQTVILPMADLPMPAGKNVIWAASFQTAWGELKKVTGGDLPGKQDMVRRLNTGRVDAADLPKDGWYAAAGRIEKGIVKKIQSEMAAKFPGVTPGIPPIEPGDGVTWLAYAYLKGEVKFTAPYFDRKSGLNFTDSAGGKTLLTSFGLHEGEGAEDANKRLAKQIEVLYAAGDERQMREFALDFDRNSKPSQLILACVEPKESLAATWRYVQQKMAATSQPQPSEGGRYFTGEDKLAVPNINFDLARRYTELEKDNDFLLACASQHIRFRLDRSGATLVDESVLMVISGMVQSRRFEFDRPFMVVLRNRGSKEPYFLMWISNAELLCKK